MNEELQQHLMEFVYGLLDEDEANALCERITSDPQVARAYATVKLQCDLVGRAARFDAPNVIWSRPEGIESSNASPQAASTDWSASGYRRLANWCIGVAASGLICLVGSSYLLSSRSARDEPSAVALATAEPIQVVLTGPSKLHSEASNPFTIQVENQAGTPVSTTLNYRVYDASGIVTAQKAMSTDESGFARFDVEPAVDRQASHLEITAGDDSRAPIRRALETVPERFVTYLRMDRPLYQPGEDVLYRSVTLSRFGLQSEHEVTTLFEIVNSNDERLEGTTNAVETNDGVGWGEFKLPGDLPDGTYTLIARSPDNLFREEWRDFQVRRYEAPRLLKKLELAQDSYTLGDQVDVDFSVKRVAGEPLAESPLQVQATVDGVPLAAPQAKTDAEGNSRFSLSLPESIERGEASVSVTVQAGDDPAETITKEIPINLGKVNVDFYPEGGDLAAGLQSRVYFYGRDPLGKPTHIEGHIVNSMGREITNVVTGHEGRGAFLFTPAANEHYRLIIEKPEGVTKEVPLPVASIDRFVTIHSGLGVFEANAPIAFTLFQRTPVRPLTLAAYCRGAMIGQQTIDPKEYVEYTTAYSTLNGEMELPDHAQGVIRLTVFDSSSSPPTPIAERLVYRRVGQKLDVRITPDVATFAPGQEVEIVLQIQDENDAPVPAVLGISIVDDAVLNLAEDRSIRMPTYFHLLTEIDSPEQLEDANFYLSDKPESAAALDSLLGTQGWRRFRDLLSPQLAQAKEGGFGGGGAGLSFRSTGPNARFRPLAWYEETAIPLSTETTTTTDVREVSPAQSTRSARAAASSRTRWAAPIVIASVVLLALVGVASLRWTHGNRSLRVFAGVVAVASLLVGVLSLPRKPTQMDQATDNAAHAATEVGVAFDKSETVIDANDIDALSDEVEGLPVGGFMYKADVASKSSASDDAPMPGEPSESDFSRQLEEAPKGAARFAQPQDQPGRRADAATNKEAMELSLSEEKKTAPPLPVAQPSSEAAASPEKPQPTGALSARPLARDLKDRTFTDQLDNELTTREYAKWFYQVPANIPLADESSTTIFWLPHHEADLTGKASVYFNLPQRPSSFRAIVEAHGAGRLGAGELLIDSREP